MWTPDEAVTQIRTLVHPRPVETVALEEALGRVLAEEVVAPLNLPPFDNSALDGYALRAADTAGASPQQPVVLRELRELPAGRVATQTVAAGTAMRIMTGAPMPPGADAVVGVERTLRGAGTVAVQEEARPGQNVRRAGEDVRVGQRILRCGRPIGAAEWGILASLGRVQVPVFQRPRGAILITGDEVVGVEDPLRPGQIHDSNSYTLKALVQEYGGCVQSVQRALDTPEALRTAFDRLTGVDLILTSGGVSIGDYDLVRDVVEERGEVLLWQVAMKPGKPFLFGRVGESLLFGLPGNPVSAMVTCDLFVRPALVLMSGRTEWARPRVPTRLTTAHRSDPQRVEYVRAWTEYTAQGWRSTPTGAQGSGRLSSMLGANSYVLIPLGTADVPAGSELTAELLR